MSSQRIWLTVLSAAWLVIHPVAAVAAPLGAGFTYQGQLKQGGVPFAGSANLVFTLYDASTNGTPIGDPVGVVEVVENGLFAVELDFGVEVFNGEDRWLEVSVNGTTLSPRQHVTPTPYALQTRGLFVDENAKIGIGTTDPSHILDIHDLATSGNEPVLRLTKANVNNTTMEIKNTRPAGSGSSGGLFYRVANTDIDRLWEFGMAYRNGGLTDESFMFRTMNLDDTGELVAATILNNGNVGIGTTSPTGRLNVMTGNLSTGPAPPDLSQAGLLIGDPSDGMAFDDNQIETLSDGLHINADVSANVTLVRGGGNVGIGIETPFPTERLQVVGVIHSTTGGFKFPDGTLQTTACTCGAGVPCSDCDSRFVNEGQPNSITEGMFVNNYYTESESDERFIHSFGDEMAGGLTMKQGYAISFSNTADVSRGWIRAAEAPYTILELQAYGGMFLGATAKQFHFVEHAYEHESPPNYGTLYAAGLEATGTVTADCFSGPHCDVAEVFPLTDSREVDPGMVLVIDLVRAGHLTMSTQAYDTRVAGIVSGAGGLQPGVMLGTGGDTNQDLPVALSGRVYCFVDASQHAVAVGDLLTTSNTPGHAMKVVDFTRSQGAVLGKAMEPLPKGRKGLILVLVALQ